ncbi:MAG: TIM44-like domain-containing protein [Erysipelotrichaceae bacterium]
MKNKNRFIVQLGLCAFFVMAILIITTTPTLADVGNSFSGGGGSSGGGSYGGSYGGGGMGLSGIFFLGNSPFGMLFIVAIIVIGIISSYNRSKNGGNSGYVNPYANNGFESNTSINENQAIGDIQEIDPNFSAEHFKTYASEVYLTVQEAWENREWSIVRPFESNALFNVHNRQLKEYIEQQKTNHLDMQNVRSVVIAGFKSDGEREVITIKLDASLIDYVSDDNSGAVLEGSKTQHQHRSYRLEFIRSTGIKTNTEKEINTTNCPNCGAPTKVTSSGECEYCHSIITTGEFGWVLNQYTKW